MIRVLSPFYYMLICKSWNTQKCKSFWKLWRQHPKFFSWTSQDLILLCLNEIWEFQSKYQDCMFNSCLTKGYAYIRGTYGLQLQGWSSLQDEGCMFLRKSAFNQTTMSFSARLHTVSVYLTSNGRMLGHAGQYSEANGKG